MENLVEKSFYANMWEGLFVHKGKIYFEEDGFVFKTKVIFTIPKVHYNEINSVQEANTLGIIPNGISVNYRKGQKLVLAVNNRRTVMDFLNSMISHG